MWYPLWTTLLLNFLCRDTIVPEPKHNVPRVGGGGTQASPPTGGTTWSSSLGLVRFQIFLMMARSSSLASSIFPSVLILSDVLTSAKSVALNITVPSVLSGMFIATSLCGGWQGGELRWRDCGKGQVEWKIK